MHRMIALAFAGLVFAAGLASAQQPADPPALCNSFRNQWPDVFAGGQRAPMDAFLGRVPAACRQLRAQIERNIAQRFPQAQAPAAQPEPSRTPPQSTGAPAAPAVRGEPLSVEFVTSNDVEPSSMYPLSNPNTLLINKYDSAARAPTTRIWNLNTGAFEATHARRGPMLAPAGGRVLVRGHTGAFSVLDVRNLSLVSTLRDSEVEGFNSFRLAMSANGQRVLKVEYTRLAVWNATTGEIIARRQPSEGFNWAAALSPNGALAVFGDDSQILAWDYANDRTVATLSCGDGMRGALFSPDGQYLFAWTHDALCAWDASTFTRVYRTAIQYVHSNADFGELVFSDDAQFVVVPNGTRPATLRRASTGVAIASLAGGGREFQAADFSSDGRYFAAATDRAEIRVWDARTGALRATIAPREAQMSGSHLAFAADSRRIVSQVYRPFANPDVSRTEIWRIASE